MTIRVCYFMYFIQQVTAFKRNCKNNKDFMFQEFFEFERDTLEFVSNNKRIINKGERAVCSQCYAKNQIRSCQIEEITKNRI